MEINHAKLHESEYLLTSEAFVLVKAGAFPGNFVEDLAPTTLFLKNNYFAQGPFHMTLVNLTSLVTVFMQECMLA